MPKASTYLNHMKSTEQHEYLGPRRDNLGKRYSTDKAGPDYRAAIANSYACLDQLPIEGRMISIEYPYSVHIVPGCTFKIISKDYVYLHVRGLGGNDLRSSSPFCAAFTRIRCSRYGLKVPYAVIEASCKPSPYNLIRSDT